ncbi:MAG TPA: hypothetical protein ENJ11_05995 [Gammaproteobacteria bacterium]|nr:hypothetical protein [Gammaproteobacteria bacterium]
MSDLQKLFALMILRAAPQDLSYSRGLLAGLAAAYVFSGLIILQTTVSPDDAYIDVIFGLLVQAVFTWTVLNALGKAPRFVQTFSAMLGVGILLNLLAWPVFAVLSDNTVEEGVKSTMSLVFLMLISWEILVKGYIFMHALEMRLMGALALSFSLFFITIALSQLLFPA